MNQWLSIQPKNPQPGTFTTWDVTELAGAGARSAEVLAPAMSEHLISKELVVSATEMLPPSKLSAFLKSRLPSTQILKRGVLGEVLAVRFLEDFRGHVVPIKKLHYRTAGHDSPKATDVLAIKLNDQMVITEVAYVEAKYRTTRSGITAVALTAHDQLQKDCRDEIPGIMGFAAQILRERHDPLFAPLMTYLRDRDIDDIDTHHVVLVMDKGCWRDSDLTTLVDHEDILEPLEVYILVIDGLVAKTEAVYKIIGYEGMLDDE